MQRFWLVDHHLELLMAGFKYSSSCDHGIFHSSFIHLNSLKLLIDFLNCDWLEPSCLTMFSSQCLIALSASTSKLDFGVLEQLDNHRKIKNGRRKKKPNWFDRLFKRTIDAAPSCSQRRIRSRFNPAKPWDVAWELAMASSFNSFFLLSWCQTKKERKKEKKSFSGGTVDSHFNYKGCESTRERWDVLPFTPSLPVDTHPAN